MKFLANLLVTCVVAFVEALFIYWTWDIVMPVYFKMPEITYWHAMMLLIGVRSLIGVPLRGLYNLKKEDGEED